MAGIKAILSLFIVYHLIAVTLSPNANSFLGRVLGAYYLDYANIIGVNTPWNFFSPNPADNFRIQYSVRFPEGSGNEDIYAAFPSWYNTGVASPNEKRKLYLTRFILMDDSRLVSQFGPWMCRQHPEAAEIVSRVVVQKLPPLDRALLDTEGWKDEISEVELQAYTHYCREMTESEAL